MRIEIESGRLKGLWTLEGEQMASRQKTLECGCVIVSSVFDNLALTLCPLHAAAPKLLAACQGWLDWLAGSGDVSPLEDRTRAAVAAALPRATLEDALHKTDRELFKCPECGVMVNTPHPGETVPKPPTKERQ